MCLNVRSGFLREYRKGYKHQPEEGCQPKSTNHCIFSGNSRVSFFAESARASNPWNRRSTATGEYGLSGMRLSCRCQKAVWRSALKTLTNHEEPAPSAMILPVPSHLHRSHFITFEGLDGCGKSTQLKKLARALKRQGFSIVLTREPGGTKTGEKIRNLLLDTATSGLSPLAELALMFASRAQHIKEIIQPALAEGKIVLCDRFTDSTEAYQGGGRKLGSEPVLELHRVLCGGLQPGLTILMDSDAAHSVDRARRRNLSRAAGARRGESDENRFEQESRAFFGRVRNGYLAIAKREPERVVLVDARGTPQTTHLRIMEIVRHKLKGVAKT
jgi:dTMP kinase